MAESLLMNQSKEATSADFTTIVQFQYARSSRVSYERTRADHLEKTQVCRISFRMLISDLAKRIVHRSRRVASHADKPSPVLMSGFSVDGGRILDAISRSRSAECSGPAPLRRCACTAATWAERHLLRSIRIQNRIVKSKEITPSFFANSYY